MARTDNDSGNKSKVSKELLLLKGAYEDLLIDSKVLLSHHSTLKKKNKELIL